MYCTKCGNKLNQGDKYCGKCGKEANKQNSVDNGHFNQREGETQNEKFGR